MGAEQRRTSEPCLLMRARLLGLGRNQLRRPSDRFESLVVVLALLAGLLMVPIGVATGAAIERASEQRTAQEVSLLQQGQATTTEDTPALTGQEIGQATWPVAVVWQDLSGVERRARADVALGTKAGSEVPIWLDRSGQITKPPRSAGDSAAMGGAGGLATVLGSWLLLWLLVFAVRCLLDRRRLSNWEAEWKRVAPRWTRES